MNWKKLFNICPKPIIPGLKVIYSPKKDITAYQTSQCLSIFVFDNATKGLGSNYESLKFHIKTYPKNVQRHFKFPDETKK